MQNNRTTKSASRENSNQAENSAKPSGKRNLGFYKRRRGILEHIEDETIDLLESGIHDYLNLKANLVIGNGYKWPAGVVSTSAPAILAYCKYVSERTIRRILNHLEEIGWIKRWQIPGKRGNYLVLICHNEHGDKSEERVTVGPNNVLPAGVSYSFQENDRLIPDRPVPDEPPASMFDEWPSYLYTYEYRGYDEHGNWTEMTKVHKIGPEEYVGNSRRTLTYH